MATPNSEKQNLEEVVTEEVKSVKQEQEKTEKIKKVKKEKKVKQHKVGKVKETVSELKKVSWPSFGSVVKKTLVVLGMVIFFTLVLFAIDSLLQLAYNPFVSWIDKWQA